MIYKSIWTDRLHLDTLDADDHAFILAIVNSEGWLTFIGDRKVRTQADALAYIDKILNTPDLYYWVIRVKEDQTPIGIVSFLKRDYLEHFDIGFALLPTFQGGGYAYEAAQKIMDTVRTYPQHQTILATTLPENTHSIRLLGRLGLTLERALDVNGEKLEVYST